MATAPTKAHRAGRSARAPWIVAAPLGLILGALFAALTVAPSVWTLGGAPWAAAPVAGAPDAPNLGAPNPGASDLDASNANAPNGTASGALPSPRQRPINPRVEALKDAASQAHATGDSDRAQRLVDQAIRLDPRDQTARVLALTLAAEANDMDRLVQEVTALIRLDQRDQRVYLESMQPLVDQPAFRAAVARAAAARTASPTDTDTPDWATERLVHLLIDQGQVDRDLISLAVSTPDGLDRLARRLMRAGDVERAFTLWFTHVSAEERARFSWPVNPDLHRDANNTPFTWSLDRQSAEWLATGGVYAVAAGDRPRRHLSQSMLLTTGPYALTVDGAVTADPEGAQFELSITCGNTAALATTRLNANPDTPRLATLSFTVPAACPVQTVAITSQPGLFPLPAQIEVARIALTRARPLEAG